MHQICPNMAAILQYPEPLAFLKKKKQQHYAHFTPMGVRLHHNQRKNHLLIVCVS